MRKNNRLTRRVLFVNVLVGLQKKYTIILQLFLYEARNKEFLC